MLGSESEKDRKWNEENYLPKQTQPLICYVTDIKFNLLKLMSLHSLYCEIWWLHHLRQQESWHWKLYENNGQWGALQKNCIAIGKDGIFIFQHPINWHGMKGTERKTVCKANIQATTCQMRAAPSTEHIDFFRVFFRSLRSMSDLGARRFILWQFQTLLHRLSISIFEMRAALQSCAALIR